MAFQHSGLLVTIKELFSFPRKLKPYCDRNNCMDISLKNKNIATPRSTFIYLGVLGLLTPLISRFLADSDNTLIWLIDLAANLQWFHLGILVLGIAMSLRHSRRFLLAIVFIPLPWLTAAEKAPGNVNNGPELTIASANINFKNQDTDRLVSWIRKHKADIVVLLELSHDQALKVTTLKEYPFQQVNPDNSPFGIGVLSKLPFAAVTVDWNNGSSLKLPTVEIIAEWDTRLIKVVAFHPMPPIAPEYHLARNRKLKEIVNESKQSGLPTVIAGDFNATPWSSALFNIDYKRATGIQSTWPMQHFGIPVDQVLISEHWQVSESQVGTDIGSDHLPVISRVSLIRELTQK